ncbi:MAG: cation:dicarboxylase symporter family transporter [Firmicutes bacterium]|nr:cation:dicarboxylase symporter family transporter [Bacillota bacterium]MCL1954046.1 cation:dicarboxylase symporter family transporter [Bacillota bacterium]
MNNNFAIFLALIVFVALFATMVLISKKTKIGFTLRVFIALILGLIYGACIQLIFGIADTSVDTPNNSVAITQWINIIGSGFTKALTFLVIPLVFVSILNAIKNLGKPGQGLKKAGMIIGILLLTTLIAGIIAMITVWIFGINTNDLVGYDPQPQAPSTLPEIILNLIPNNLFAAFSGSNVLPVVLITFVIGMAYLDIKKHKPAIGQKFESFLDTAYEVVIRIVDYVIGFTPYGVLAIIAGRAASAGWESVAQLGMVVVVCYVAMAIVFLFHLLLMWVSGVNPKTHIKKAGAALMFAFSSRSSSATLSLTIMSQRKLGVNEGNANLAGSFGTTIGQNACAGVYPVTLAILAGMSVGWDVWSLQFLVPLAIYSVISSIGTAGVGGGATQVSLMVLSLMGLPVELVGLLISVDFLIDMGRTAINVNDSILAGYIAGKLERDINKDILHDKKTIEQVELEAKANISTDDTIENISIDNKFFEVENK